MPRPRAAVAADHDRGRGWILRPLDVSVQGVSFVGLYCTIIVATRSQMTPSLSHSKAFGWI